MKPAPGPERPKIGDMDARKLTVLLAAVAGLSLSAWLTAGPQVRRIDEGALKNAGKSGEDWLTYGSPRPRRATAR